MRTCSYCGPVAAPESAKFCPICGKLLLVAQTPVADPDTVPPPPPAQGQEFNYQYSYATGGLPPAPPHWPFQDQTTQWAKQLIEGLGQAAAQPNWLGRIVRASLLDKTVYREVAVDQSLQKEAWMLLGAIAVLGSIGLSFLSLSLLFSFTGMMNLISVALYQLIGLLVRVWVVQVIASLWLQKRITFPQFFRSLTYAQSPAMLQGLPLVGQVVELWCVVTSTAAIRDITGCTAVQAVVLAIAGVVGMLLPGYVLY